MTTNLRAALNGMSQTPERRAKRVRQACQPCRRKKAKCPGEQPVCSLCARLQQRCTYSGERHRPQLSDPVPLTEPASGPVIQEVQYPPMLEDRLGNLESKLGQVLDVLGQNTPRMDEPTPTNSLLPVNFNRSGASPTSIDTPLPPWDQVFSAAELYLLYCDSQPLPLFHRESFLASLDSRDPEIIYAIMALSIRFSENLYDDSEIMRLINAYTELARSLVMKRISEGPVELSTLQCLCLLSLVDFTNCNTHRSSIHSSLAMNLAQCANLGSESSPALNLVAREERRRCFWSICLLKRLHGGEFTILEGLDGNFPPFPESPGRPPSSSPPDSGDGTRSSGMEDQGIIAYVVIISAVFAKTAGYVRHHGKPSNVPPWSAQSEYSKIITMQMEMETRMPYIHRFKPANLKDRTGDELQANRIYWGPWFLNQFMYHTILCLLNHPLLLSLSLRNFRSTIPEIFLQHTSDLISTHTTWIIHFINYFEEKSFTPSDPLLGYSAAVVATIELQLSFTENPTIRQEKRDHFSKCVKFVQSLGKKWPHMARLADRLQRLEGAVSASYQPDPRAQNKSLLIDLSRFWEILEHSSNSDADSARRLFGDSLYAGPPTFDAEVSQTSPLPEPTRVSSDPTQSHPQSQGYSVSPAFPGETDCAMSAFDSSRPLDVLNDEFSILATNFFSQGQEFLRGGDGRENVGNY